MEVLFRKIATHISAAAGSAKIFALALLVISLWIITGPLFNFSNTWQLFINTTTTIITFLMVFLIQNTQNRDSKTIHLKLDELISSMAGARDGLVNVEELSDTEIDHLHEEFRQMQEKYLQKFRHKKGKLKLVFEKTN